MFKKIYCSIVEGIRKSEPQKRWTDVVSELFRARGFVGEHAKEIDYF